MQSDNDSWEDIPINTPIVSRQTLTQKSFITLNSFIYIYTILPTIQYIDLSLLPNTDYNLYKLIILKFNKITEKSDLIKNIKIFKTCIFYKIKVRICFAIENEIISFLETGLCNYVERSKLRFGGPVYGLDYEYNLVDLTYLYSKNVWSLELSNIIKEEFKLLANNNSVLVEANDSNFLFTKSKEINQTIINNINYDSVINSNTIFIEEDNKQNKKIPTSLNKLKKHPIYVVESILKDNFFIWPKRKSVGFFKGEPVYLKTQIKKLLTQQQWYKSGKNIKNTSPYKIINDKKLYSHWQTEDISIEKLTSQTMPYFHPNFIPKNHFHSSNIYSSEVAKILKLNYSDTLIGFRNKIPVIQGIFLDIKYQNLFLNALNEYLFYKNIRNEIKNKKSVLKQWKKVIEQSIRFIKIRKRIDN